MVRKVLAITGSRAEYGAMRPVFRAIAASTSLSLDLVITGMHLAPQFAASLREIEADAIGTHHKAAVSAVDGSALAMARSMGEAVIALSQSMVEIAPNIVLVQGDRGEMLAGAIAAAHLNRPLVHMSGGDRTGTIDDSIRNAITSFAHVHLTTCADSTARLIAMGEARERVFEVGEPTLDVILALDPVPLATLAAEFSLDPERPLILATQHPVTTEAEHAGVQIVETLEALSQLGMQTLFTFPNTDAGHQAIVHALQAWRDRDFLRVVPHVGSEKYLSLMRNAALVVGNSSSGIIEAASFKVPVVNIGTRQHRRTRACNVIDAGYDRGAIVRAARHALSDDSFRSSLASCRNPYGDGRCAERTLDILTRLVLDADFTAKWLARSVPILA